MRKSVVIIGAGGSVGLATTKVFLKNKYKVYAYSTKKSPFNKNSNIVWNMVESYESISIFPKFTFALICNGSFEPMPLVKNNYLNIKKSLRINLEIPMLLTLKLIQSLTQFDSPVNIMMIGSTSAYEGFSGSSDYVAAKHGLLGFVRALNKEYEQTNVKFILFSPGSIQNKMGSKVVTSKKRINPNQVSDLIFSNLTELSIGYQPEIILRRRII